MYQVDANTFYTSLRQPDTFTRKRSTSNKRLKRRGSDGSNSPEAQLKTDFEDWQQWNPALNSVQMKRMQNHQRLQSERLSIPRDCRFYYKRWREQNGGGNQSFAVGSGPELLMASELAQQNSPNRPLKRQTRAYSNLKAKIAEKVLLSVRGA